MEYLAKPRTRPDTEWNIWQPSTRPEAEWSIWQSLVLGRRQNGVCIWQSLVLGRTQNGVFGKA